IARTFREKDIPADVIVLDIHYMDAYKIFTWDKKKFPDPKAMITELKAMGFEVVVMCDPGIKVEKGYEAYDDGVKKNVFLKYPDGENYEGQVWPGWCHFPDFSDPKAREWWGTKFKSYADLGVLGYWKDMNEIATWGQALPENLEFSFEGNKNTTRRGRNIYGFQMARSTYEGAKKQLNGKRPFTLTRAGFSGVQRYGAVWTGDNLSYDEHMLLGVRLVNSMGLTGIAFAGYDVGGFVGDANTKLFARWVSIGALSPFFRGHTMINSRDSEPWSYGEEVEMIARNYIKLRYQLLPYIYSLFYEASQTGMPVQRSLAINYPFASQIYSYANQYLFGPSILVAPVESNKDMTKIYLPEGEWYYLYDGKKFAGDQEIIMDCPVHKLPVFIKTGAILPMQPAQTNTADKNDTLHLHVYNGKEASEFLFYQDDGTTYDYQNENFAKRLIQFNPASRTISLAKTTGKFSSPYKKLTIYLHGFDKIGNVKQASSTYPIESITHSLFSPLEKYDPFYDPDSMGEEIVQKAVLNYSSEH
ncbi:MAG TPA: TIM-barrel domain-containing protein, partial [Cyclobacteriaceae bacterium]|nr:TIM-barrel domain-containing protein [Cyclobacteriaceae bacterium]